MIKILDGLYLGNREAARDLVGLRQEGVTHVVNCAIELPNYHEGELTYLALCLNDPDPNFAEQIHRTCTFIDRGRQQGRVLVHCFAAISRSPAMVLAYLCHLGDPLDRAARRLGDIVWTDPDKLFISQLANHLGVTHTPQELEGISSILSGRM